MTTRDRLRLMDEIKRKNQASAAEYMRRCRQERRREILADLWEFCKGSIISAAVGVFLGYLVIWLSGC